MIFPRRVAGVGANKSETENDNEHEPRMRRFADDEFTHASCISDDQPYVNRST